MFLSLFFTFYNDISFQNILRNLKYNLYSQLELHLTQARTVKETISFDLNKFYFNEIAIHGNEKNRSLLCQYVLLKK